ncbi:DoxX family membrane protein, partial [bacterium]
SALHTLLRHAPCAVVVLGGLLALFDINRMQPWFYQSMLMFFGLGVTRRKDAWAICGFILSATYVWSGLQKVNASFAADVFPWLLKPLGLEALQPFWWLAPLLETSVGVLLIVPRTRRWGLAGAGAIHAFLLIALGPWGQSYNSVVWPWNVWMPLLAFVMFFRNPESLLPSAWRARRGKIVLVLVGALPFLSFFGRWDTYLSAALYSGRADQGYLLFTEEGVRRLPAQVQPFVNRLPDRIGLDLFRWSMAEMNVPCYPEVRVYQAIGRKLEQTGVPADGMMLVVTDRPSLTSAKPRTRVIPVR